MADGYEEESVIDLEELIFQALCDSGLSEQQLNRLDLGQFQIVLADLGYMIVPIEDPTNLFGVMEDSL